MYPASLGYVSSPYHAVMSTQFPAICVGFCFVMKQERLPVTTVITVGLAPRLNVLMAVGHKKFQAYLYI